MKLNMKVSGVIFCLLSGIFSLQSRCENVAEGFLAWNGIEDKNHIQGRRLCPSDMRHRIVVVVEIDPTDIPSARKQLDAVGDFNSLCTWRSNAYIQWEKEDLKRNPLVLVSLIQPKVQMGLVPDALAALTKDGNKQAPRFGVTRIPVYANVKPACEPMGAGMCPSVYVLGVDGRKLYSGVAGANAVAPVKRAIQQEEARLKKEGWEWKPYTGTLEASSIRAKSVLKCVDPAKPKPLAGEYAKLAKGILSNDSAVARESQILFDALEQARSDLLFKIEAEYKACPHVAAFDIDRLSKLWPKEKGNVAKFASKVKARKECAPLIPVYARIQQLRDPGFKCKNAAEAKKIVGELEKMKGVLEKPKASKDIQTQNGALLLETAIDELIATIPASVE